MRILGFTEKFNTCSMCNKTELKGTYVVELDCGDIIYLGSTCVKKRFSFSQKEFKIKIRKSYNSALNHAHTEYNKWLAAQKFDKDLEHGENPFEFESDNWIDIDNKIEIIILKKKAKLSELRNKLLLQKAHFNVHSRIYKI